jgi:hypothetical protein
VSSGPAPFLWICGASGAGKSSVGWEIFGQVRAAGVQAAYVDFDQIGFCLPAREDDPDTHRIKALNLGAMWPNFRSAGARCLISSGFVNTRDVIRMYAGAVPGTALTVCRLRAGNDELTKRIFLRGQGGGPPIPGDELTGQPAGWLARFAAESVRDAADLERDGIGDLCVDTDGRSIAEVARLVRAAAGGWPRPG